MTFSPRHVCFDKDGTLIDVHTYWNHTCRIRTAVILETYGLAPSTEESLLEAMGIEAKSGRILPGGPVGYHPRTTIISALREALTGLGRTPPAEELNRLFQDVDERQQASDDYKTDLLPGVVGLLENLRQTNCSLTVFSSDRKINTERTLERLGIRTYFQAVIGGDSVRIPKPDPEGFRIACGLVAAQASQSVYVGDTVSDLEMGIAGGAGAVVGVSTGLDTFQDLAAKTPHVCRRLSEFPIWERAPK